MQFALIISAFFVLSLNAISAPVAYDSALANPLINYNPIALAQASRDISHYVPILASMNPDEIHDQVLSAVVGSETAYTPKPMLVETIDYDTARRIRQGLRPGTISHTVAQGETLSKIASQYEVNVATLMEANEITVKDLNKIRPGTTLAIPPEKTTESLVWLDQLHEEERKAREQREKERRAQLARSSQGRIARARASNTGPEPSSDGRFRRPITSGGYNGYHWWASDHPADIGAAIYAAADGVVEVADPSGYNGGYGKTVVIRHGNGWETRYAHLQSVNVAPGERVSAGEVIAASGNTGRSTGPHLHFEIVKNGQRLNPCKYIGC